MDKIRPDSSSTPVSQPGSSTSTQTRWSAAGAHLGGRLADVGEKTINGASELIEETKEQKYADTAIEILDLLAQLHDLWQKDPPDINGAIKQAWDKLENLYRTNPNIFDGSFSVDGKTFTLKSLLGAMFDGNMTYYDKGDFENFWSKGVGGSPPAVIAIVAVLLYQGSDMKMDFYGNANGPKDFVRACRIMAAVATTPELAEKYDTKFWGWTGSVGNFADIFPNMLMVYLYDKYTQGGTTDWDQFRAEYNQIVGELPKPGSNTPHYEKAYNELQEWMKDEASWESWDDLPVGYSRDFIMNDVAYPSWKEWRKS